MTRRADSVSRRGWKHLAIGLLAGALAAGYARQAPTLTAPAMAQQATPTQTPAIDGDLLELVALQRKFQAVVDKVAPTVVAISAAVTAVDTDTGVRSEEMSVSRLQSLMDRTTRIVGTGFIIDPEGYILTNEHVVGEAEQLWVTTDDRRIFPAIVVGSDPRADLAVLKVPASGLPTVTFADISQVTRGQWAIALGNPYGLAAEGQMSMSIGVISALNRSLPKLASKENRLYTNLIQTTAQINPGNSGGPLFDLEGRVVGVNMAVILPQKSTNGIGFAMPITTQLLQRVQALKEGREVVYGYMGVMVSAPTPRQRRLANVPDGAGARIDSVEAESPASRAGVLPGDIVVNFNGQTITDSDQFIRLVGDAPVDRPLEMVAHRDGQVVTLAVTLGRRQMPSLAVSREKQRLRWRGLLLGPVPEHWDGAQGNKPEGGIMVYGVETSSDFAAQGVSAGTIITAIAGKRIADLVNLQQILNETPAEQCSLELYQRPAHGAVATAGVASASE